MIETTTDDSGSAPSSSARAPRGAHVRLDGVSHHYPLSRDLDHGWVPSLVRLVSPAARARHEAEAAKPSELAVLDGINLDIAPGRVRGSRGPVRLRQVDDPAAARRTGEAERRTR